MNLNSTVYLFGNLGNGYTQYPDDYSKEIFDNFYQTAASKTQIAIHRNKNLIYYGYIRKLDTDSQYIGFCILLNSAMFTDFSKLFSVFEMTISDIVAKGKIIGFNDKGELISKIDCLSDNIGEVNTVTRTLTERVNNLEDAIEGLKQVNYSQSHTSNFKFSLKDNIDDIIESSYKNKYTYVFKDDNYDTDALISYRQIISRLHREKVEIQKKYDDLQIQYNKLNQRKKQYRKIIILCLIIGIGGIILYFLKNSLDDTRNNLYEAELQIEQDKRQIDTLSHTIGKLHATITSQNNQINDLNCKNRYLKDYLSNSRDSLSNLKNTIESKLPIIITSAYIANVDNSGNIQTSYGGTIYSSSSMYLKPKIYYNAISPNKAITLRVKLYTPNGKISRGNNSPSDCSFTYSINSKSGNNNSETLSGWGQDKRGNWEKGAYRYEFWYGNICLYAKNFQVY